MSRIPLNRALALALATLTLASAQNTPGTPIFVQPPQQQTPGVGQQMPQVVTAPPASAPASERLTLWGGVASELYVLPGVMIGASAPVGRLGNVNLALRAGAEAIIIPVADIPGPLPVVNVDLLLSGRGRGLQVYGGPSVGTVLGAAWLLGGVAGVRGSFGAGPWGYFAEGKARVLYVGAEGRGALFTPGLNLGVTYRF
jgi:hypothetical protein